MQSVTRLKTLKINSTHFVYIQNIGKANKTHGVFNLSIYYFI